MRFLKDTTDRLGIAGELLVFFWRRRMWWIIPVVSVLLLFSLLIAFGTATGVGPFIYTLF
jgi:hypothetical protein